MGYMGVKFLSETHMWKRAPEPFAGCSPRPRLLSTHALLRSSPGVAIDDQSTLAPFMLRASSALFAAASTRARRSSVLRSATTWRC